MTRSAAKPPPPPRRGGGHRNRVLRRPARHAPAPRSSTVTWGSSAFPAGTATQDLTYRFVIHTSIGGRDSP
ncbi:hypothetical protein [Streptomyces malaysiensis]|uniref:hypothetical protein n=1 Tax=Streptomyces malaysiensis TaxID=92644 RepID=UPI00142F055F|nr:hypothetical protein [Streptomyces malaysiensis]